MHQGPVCLFVFLFKGKLNDSHKAWIGHMFWTQQDILYVLIFLDNVHHSLTHCWNGWLAVIQVTSQQEGSEFKPVDKLEFFSVK